ncbi:leucine-rich repeat domain-containing protein, partial [Leptospira santarosai]
MKQLIVVLRYLTSIEIVDKHVLEHREHLSKGYEAFAIMKSYLKNSTSYLKPAFGKFHRIFKTTSICDYKSKAESLNFLYCTDIFNKETEMNPNPHLLTKSFRNIGAIFSTILFCFCCTIEAKEKGVYYNLT